MTVRLWLHPTALSVVRVAATGSASRACAVRWRASRCAVPVRCGLKPSRTRNRHATAALAAGASGGPRVPDPASVPYSYLRPRQGRRRGVRFSGLMTRTLSMIHPCSDTARVPVRLQLMQNCLRDRVCAMDCAGECQVEVQHRTCPTGEVSESLISACHPRMGGLIQHFVIINSKSYPVARCFDGG